MFDMATYKLPNYPNLIVDPVITKEGRFGFDFSEDSSGDFGGTIHFIMNKGLPSETILEHELTSEGSEAPNLDNTSTDEQRVAIIDAWVLAEIEEFKQ